MKTLFLLIAFVMCLGLSAEAQIVYNPTLVEFDSPDHASLSYYVVEFWLSTAPQVGTPVQAISVPVSKVTVASIGPPIQYQILFTDIPIYVPFGSSYVVDLMACTNTSCSGRSPVSAQNARYSTCVSSSTTLTLMTLTQGAITTGPYNGYVAIPLTIASYRPVHYVSIALTGSGLPAFYFTGFDLRGSPNFTIGPLKHRGRFLVNIYVMDESGCSAQQASQYITVQ
jgi:hypothetical protein